MSGRTMGEKSSDTNSSASLMKITVITPVYNDPRIERCLRSVAQQRTEAEIEHVVVDSLSTDETVDILESFEDQIDILVREDDDGLYDGINKGIDRSTGDVVGILNADDRYQDETVIDDVATAMRNPDVDACYGDLVYVDDSDDVVRYWQSGTYHPYKFYLGWMPPHPTFYVKRGVYENLGYYDTSFPISADYELLLRFLLMEDVQPVYIDRVLVRMATGGMSNSSLKNKVQVLKDIYHAWDKHNQIARFSAPFFHPLERVPQYILNPPKLASKPATKE